MTNKSQNPLQAILTRLKDPGETKFVEDLRTGLEETVSGWNKNTGQVETAVALSAAQKHHLTRTIQSKFPAVSRVDFSVNPDLIAGLSVRIGDHLVDLSLNNVIHQIQYQVV